MTLGWSELHSQLIAGAMEKKEFFSASFELTARCNLQCKMCYVRRSANDKIARSKELSTAEWIRLAEEARDAGLLLLALTGGEVFLREDFKILYEKFMKLGFILQILTNGTLITPQIADWLAGMPPSKVSITIYGASPEAYQRVTGFAEGFDKTIRAVDSLLTRGINTSIRTTVIKENEDEFDGIFDLALRRELPLGIVNYISPSREADNSDPLGNRLSPAELFRYEMHIAQRQRQVRPDNDASKTRTIDTMDEDAFFSQIADQHKEEPGSAFPCTAGSCAGWVTWDGRLLPCGLLDNPESYPLKIGFSAAWEELKQKCNIIPACKECRQCQYQALCEHCPARLYQETGRYDKPAPYLCALARSRMEYKKACTHKKDRH
ncbi:radical SAM protein [Dehalobacter sp. TeCB1]|uniref:radical SAM protein n=1 Tax=Dehalobacter sp. TeCB1 TaxID=1843715 RepID=UPI00083B75EF|nr:radical SAM protein [Dehalobacter sp. TeCB1]OCZ49461.1 radical SAM protein [Dehalobacter sp. TeCB1]